MATIKDLKVSISEMTFSQACALVKESRLRRRLSKEKPKRVLVKMETNRKVRKTQAKAVSKLTREQAAALLKLLSGG
jgi:hypothetical protein